MDGIVGKVGGRFRISLTESTMMKILHSAMDKSHERVKSEEGVILRLTEISKFYELAVMLLDGCLRFVHDEADSNAMEEENVVGELAEIRDRLRGRLRETELAIAEKDSEFRRRYGDGDESPDLKRFDSLGVDFRLEKLKGDGNSEEEFSELQHSVDQQVMNIKQKLGPEYKMVEKRRNKSLDCLKIDQMSSDIDILKGTMDLAFGKMHSAISLAESEKRGEQQWGWEVERRTTAVLMRGIVEDSEERYVSELNRREELVTEIGMLRNGKEDLQFQIATVENTYLAIIQGLLNDHDVEIEMSKGIVNEIVRRSVHEWKQKLGMQRIEAQIREGVYSESLKEMASSLQFSVLECQDVSNECKLYAEAFNRRCENLRKAEIEVDLLGDQVDALLGLLEKIYQILYHYAPTLQQHFEVWDILLMMKRELMNQKGSLV